MRLKTGDRIQVGIAAYDVLSDETAQRHVIVRGHVTGKTKVVRVDTAYTMRRR